VLFRVAQQMQSCVRSYDSVGRYGGEEFLIVLPGCSSRMATERAEQIRLVLSEPIPDARENRITASMGVVAAHGAAKVEELLSQADAALYRAKHAGRKRVESLPDTDHSTPEMTGATDK
jgi:diguanylate cyclase (GGDEF)-like protein